MAGQTQAFAEAIQWTLAHNIVQMAQPRPWFIVLYTYQRNRGDYAQPYAMISKNEYGQPEGTFKVRVWSNDGWDYLEPMFARSCRAAEFLVRYHSPEPNRHLGIGCSRVSTTFPIVFPIPRHQLRHASTACQWLREHHLFFELAEQFGSHTEAMRDWHAQGEFVEERENWNDVLEACIDDLIRITQ